MKVTTKIYQEMDENGEWVDVLYRDEFKSEAEFKKEIKRRKYYANYSEPTRIISAEVEVYSVTPKTHKGYKCRKPSKFPKLNVESMF